MADRSVREYSTQAPAPYVGQFLQGGIFPYAQRFLHGQFANMGAPDSSPYTYTGPRVAQFDPRERMGMQMSDQAIGSYSPYLGSQSSLLGQATDYLRKGTGAGSELTGEAAGMYRGLGRDFDPSAYKEYMSPYTENVIDRSLGDIREQMEKQKMGVRDRAVSAGAFGGSRGRLAEGDIERAGLRSMGDVSAGLREKGYGQSQQQAFQEFARRQAERGGTAQGLAGLGQQYYGMGLGSAGGLGTLGGQFGSMAPSLQNLQTGDINRTMQFGGLRRGRQQSLMDLGYQNFVGQYNLPMQTLQNVGALTASLGPMAGGYGFAGADQDVALTGTGAKFAPVGGGIGTPGAGSYQPYSTGFGNFQPHTASTPTPTGTGTPTPTPGVGPGPGIGPIYNQGQTQSNIGGGPATGSLPPVGTPNYNTYGNNMPIRAAEGKPLTQEGRELSDADIQLAYMLAAAQGQEGRELSDKDLKFHLDMMGRTSSDRDSGRTLSDLEYYMDLIGRTMSDRDIGRTMSDRDMKVGKPGYNRRTIRRAGGGGIRSLKYNG